MTRYTKLDGRKALHKATNLSAPRVPQEPDHPTASTSTAPLSPPPPTSAKNPEKTPSSDLSTQESSREILADPKKLQSRLKLLRLKIKNAKTEDKKISLRRELAGVQQALHAANGEKGKTSDEEITRGKGELERAGKDGANEKAGAGETNPWKKMEAERRAKTSASSEARRERRIAERNLQTRCFACRAMGHAAKDCPEALNSASTALEEGGEDASTSQPTAVSSSTLTGKETVGICFRCGSTQHILAKCRRPAPQVGSALPFATCFVCQQKGHLSSKCPQNTSHGVYPNGGCCKLCSSVEHLAKDCHLRSSSSTVASNAAIGGAAKRLIGADEDDFIDFARRKVEVEREERNDAKRRKTTTQSAVKVPSAKKVVTF